MFSPGSRSFDGPLSLVRSGEWQHKGTQKVFLMRKSGRCSGVFDLPTV